MEVSDWTLLVKHDGGHSYWEAANGGVAIADESADGPGARIGRPDETDDGVLWVDRGRRLSAKLYDSGWSLCMPVTDDDGNESVTFCDRGEMKWVSGRYKWLIEIDGLLYTSWLEDFWVAFADVDRSLDQRLFPFLYKPTSMDIMGQSV